MAGIKLVSLAVPLLLTLTACLAPIIPTLAAGKDGYRLFNSVILMLEHQYGAHRARLDEILEDLKSYRDYDPKNIGDPEVDSQLDELIGISNIDIKNCNPEYYEKLNQVRDKYSLLTQFILPNVISRIRQQDAECRENALKVFANTMDKISLDQRKIINKIREKVRNVHSPSLDELTPGLVDFIKDKEEGAKIFGELKGEDHASYGQLFREKLVDNLCKPIVEELKIVAQISQKDQTSLILEHWLKNYSICSLIVSQTDELIARTHHKL